MNKASRSYKELESEIHANPEFLGLFREEILNSNLKNIGDINLTETETNQIQNKTDNKTDNKNQTQSNQTQSNQTKPDKIKKKSKQELKFDDKAEQLELDDYELNKLKSLIKYFLNINK